MTFEEVLKYAKEQSTTTQQLHYVLYHDIDEAFYTGLIDEDTRCDWYELVEQQTMA